VANPAVVMDSVGIRKKLVVSSVPAQGPPGPMLSELVDTWDKLLGFSADPTVSESVGVHGINYWVLSRSPQPAQI